MASLKVRIEIDGDYLRLVAYRFALQEIQRLGALQPWEREDDDPEPAEIAEAALRAFEDIE